MTDIPTVFYEAKYKKLYDFIDTTPKQNNNFNRFEFVECSKNELRLINTTTAETLRLINDHNT